MELNLVVKALEEKDFNYFINDINLVENNINKEDNQQDIICCFIGNYEIGKKLLNKISKSDKTNLPIVLVFNNNKIYENTKILVELFKNRIVFISKDYGNDIIPTIQAINYMLNNYNIRNIYKFHTKSCEKWFNDCTDYLLNNEINYNNSKSNCIGHPNYFLNINDEKYQCKLSINKNKNIIDKSIFVRGSIFYTKAETFSSILNYMKNDYLQYFINNCYDTNAVLLDNSPQHFLERLFGIIKINFETNDLTKYLYKYIFICTSINSGDYCVAKSISENLSNSKVITTNELNYLNVKKESNLIFLDYSQLKKVNIKKFDCVKIAWVRNWEKKMVRIS